MELTITRETNEDQRAQFEKRVIAHPALDSVFKDLRAIIHRPGVVPLIEVVGPTGVGKSTTVILKSKDHIAAMPESTVAEIRKIWEATVRAPDPEGAIEIIKAAPAVKTF